MQPDSYFATELNPLGDINNLPTCIWTGISDAGVWLWLLDSHSVGSCSVLTFVHRN